jgi:GT2 family glycosyltransferase
MVPAGVSPMGRAIAAATTIPFGVPTAFHHSQRAQFTDTVYLGVWPHSVFTRVGGFDESMQANEDYELNYRIRHSGGKIYFDPKIRSIYFGRQTLGALLAQYYRYGRSKARTIKMHPASLRPRHLAAPLFTASVILGLPLAIVNVPMRVLWLGVLALYAALATIAALRQATRTSMRLFWRILVVFPAMHLAWGSGFWLGLAQRMRA